MNKKLLFRKVMTILIFIAIPLAVILFVVRFDEIYKNALDEALEPVEEKILGEDSMIFSLYGMSKNTEEESSKLLNELVLIFSYNPTTKKSVAVALPTNLYLNPENEEYPNKLSVANRNIEDKVGWTNFAVQDIIKRPIDRFVGIDLDKFAKFVDEVEGLTVGEHMMNGAEVKAYLQEIPEDLDTTAQFSRLKQILEGLINKVQNSDVMFQLSLLSKANNFMIHHNFTLDEWTKLAELAPNLFGNVELIPVSLDLETIDNEQFQVLNEKERDTIQEKITNNMKD